jgi:hypothetical protein
MVHGGPCSLQGDNSIEFKAGLMPFGSERFPGQASPESALTRFPLRQEKRDAAKRLVARMRAYAVDFPACRFEAAVEVRRIREPGLLESIYERCLIKRVDGISRLVPIGGKQASNRRKRRQRRVKDQPKAAAK